MRGIFSLVLVLALGACSGNSGLGALGDILGSVAGGGAPAGSQQQQQGQVQAEVQQVDTDGQRLHIRTQDGQSGSVRFDANTEVIYQQQRYPVTALERGDIVNLQLRQSGQDYYVARVDVVRSVQERTGGS